MVITSHLSHHRFTRLNMTSQDQSIQLSQRKALRKRQRRRLETERVSCQLNRLSLKRSSLLNHLSGHCSITEQCSATMNFAPVMSGSSMALHQPLFQGRKVTLKRSTKDIKSTEVTSWTSKMLKMTICGGITISTAILRAFLNHLVPAFTGQEAHYLMKLLAQVHLRPLYLRLNHQIRSKSLDSMETGKNTGVSKKRHTRRR